MKKPLFQRRRVVLGSGTRNQLLIAGAVIIVILLFRFVLPTAFSNTTTSLMSVGTQVTQGLSGVFAVFGDRAQLTQKIASLEQERDTLYEETVTQRSALLLAGVPLDAITVENALHVSVSARPPVSPYDTLMLTAGSDNGVVSNAIVYSQGGIPLGAIDTVSGKTSRAVLYSEAGRVTKGYVGEERLLIDIVGKGAGTFGATVSNDVAVAVGDLVYISAPDMRPLGYVSHVQASASNPETVLLIRAYTNIFTLSHVLVRRAE